MRAAPRDDDRRLFAALMAALIALAWLALWAWGQSPHGRFLSHHGLEAVRGNAALMLVFVAGWTLMVVAMMLPTSLPLVALFRALVRGRPDRARLTALLVAGYLAVWTLFGVVVYCGDFVLHGAVERSAWLGANVVPFIGAGTLIVAGLYQFTPLKGACLRQCQSPLGFVMTRWRDGHAGALRMGAVHGAYCLGCCWALFAVLVAAGVMSLAWMLLLTLVVFAEKALPLGRRAPRVVGAAFLLLGVLVAVGAADMPWHA
jgi:predicted metal-binding membrane protein